MRGQSPSGKTGPCLAEPASSASSSVRYKFDLAYMGSGFHGWQSQRSGATLQDLFRRALKKIELGGRAPVGCSRTDSGVHARRYSAHVANARYRSCEHVLAGLNAALPSKMRIYRACVVSEDFHARYSCLQKTYRYFWHRGAVVPPPQSSYVHRWGGRLDEDAMAEAARLFEGRHDFSRLTTLEGRRKGSLRTIDRCLMSREGDLLVMEVRGKAFLHRMVRMMAGALLAVGTGRLGKEELLSLLDGLEPPFSIPALPARGLTLWDVRFSGFKEIESAGRHPSGRDWPV